MRAKPIAQTQDTFIQSTSSQLLDIVPPAHPIRRSTSCFIGKAAAKFQLAWFTLPGLNSTQQMKILAPCRISAT
jgi:hypothetical protein